MILDQDLIDQYQAALDREDADTLDHLAEQIEGMEAAEAERLTRPGALKSAALWYASQGVPVFPLLPRDKKPFPKSHGFEDATVDPRRINAWWDRHPEANIGAATGHVFDVIDIDPPAGYLSLAALRDERLIPPTIGRALTGRRGVHLFIEPTGDGNGAKIRPGVDYRGAGGYVVLPPSIGATGNRYAWTEPLHITGGA